MFRSLLLMRTNPASRQPRQQPSPSPRIKYQSQAQMQTTSLSPSVPVLVALGERQGRPAEQRALAKRAGGIAFKRWLAERRRAVQQEAELLCCEGQRIREECAELEAERRRLEARLARWPSGSGGAAAAVMAAAGEAEAGPRPLWVTLGRLMEGYVRVASEREVHLRESSRVLEGMMELSQAATELGL
ncbi:hypothetical protein PLESTM_001658300 [Pleodorina starrii]|nr:hypothetical protein PLESTM_001658300 [Pleodorina starrii]